MTLIDQLATIDRLQARRFSRLGPTAQEIATRGIQRHLAACTRHGVDPDISAIREIIDDAQVGRAIFEEKADVAPVLRPLNNPKYALLTDRPWVQSLLAKESFTATEAASRSNLSANDVICRLRQSRLLRLKVVGYVDGKQNGVRLYRLERVEGENNGNAE